MKDLVCNYTLVRFLPYRETGEFVNIGIILYAPEFNHFDFKLANKANRRVRGFFPEMDDGVYRAAMERLQRELERQQVEYIAINSVEQGLKVFGNMLRRRETLLHFAEPGMRVGEPRLLLEELFAEYVERRFAHVPKYQEVAMQNQLNGWLREWGVRKQYKRNATVGDDMFHLTLPFVRRDGDAVTAAIQPLDLDRPDTSKIFDHGGLWIQRFRRLKDRNQMPARMIVPILLPLEARRIAADEIVNELEQTDVRVVPIDDKGRIHELAIF
jgi:hypothetical protein